MARLNTRASTMDSLYRDGTPTSRSGEKSPTPGASFSSDKENNMGPPENSKRATATAVPANPNKKRRLGEQGQSTAAPQATQAELDDEDKRFYDPEQAPEDRRRVRMGMRENARELHGELTSGNAAYHLLILLRRPRRRARQRRWHRASPPNRETEHIHEGGETNI